MTSRSDPGPDAIRPPDPRMISFRVPPPVGRVRRHAQPPEGRPADVPPVPATGDTGTSGDAGVRPFVVTGGRTEPVDERLRIETQVVATPRAAHCVLDFECRRIVDLCPMPLSVAEIAAALDLPLIVARVLVADLAAIGAVAVQEQGAPVSRAVLERILEGVRAL